MDLHQKIIETTIFFLTFIFETVVIMITSASFLFPLLFLWMASTSWAQTNNNFCADVIGAQFSSGTIFATISSPYETGWDQYADEFRVMTTWPAPGTLLATRPLTHPHVTEQPFTRSVVLPDNVLLVDNGDVVAVSARDSINGYCGQVFLLNITSNSPVTNILDNVNVTAAPSVAPLLLTFRPSLSPNEDDGKDPSASTEQSYGILYYSCLFSVLFMAGIN